jgi:hypothetical protein
VKLTILFSAVLIVASVLASAAAPPGAKPKEDPNTRSVQGAVEDSSGNLVEGAVVQLKNTKSLKVISYITQKEGTYAFLGLSKDVDYELKADFRGGSSPVRTLSVYDSRKKATINLKVEPKK